MERSPILRSGPGYFLGAGGRNGGDAQSTGRAAAYGHPSPRILDENEHILVF